MFLYSKPENTTNVVP